LPGPARCCVSAAPTRADGALQSLPGRAGLQRSAICEHSGGGAAGGCTGGPANRSESVFWRRCGEFCGAVATAGASPGVAVPDLSPALSGALRRGVRRRCATRASAAPADRRRALLVPRMWGIARVYAVAWRACCDPRGGCARGAGAGHRQTAGVSYGDCRGEPGVALMSWRTRAPRLGKMACPHCSHTLSYLAAPQPGQLGVCSKCHGVLQHNPEGIAAVQDEELGDAANVVAEIRRQLGPALPAACLTCKHPLDAATGTRPDEAVHPGGLSVCFYCGAAAMFAEDLRLRPLTAEEEAKVRDDPILARMRALIAAHRSERGAN